MMGAADVAPRITGIGIISSHGIGADKLWDRVEKGVPALETRKDWSDPDIGEILVGKTPNDSFRDVLPRLKARFPARYSRLALAATALAVLDADLDFGAEDRGRVGTLMSSDLGPLETVESYLTALLVKGPIAVSPVQFSRTVANVALGDIARYFQLRGPSALLVGSEAVPLAADLISDGEADIVICTAFDELREMMVLAYSKLGLLTTTGEPAPPGTIPEGVALGEAAVSVVVESAAHASRRQKRPYATILSYATTCDASANFNLRDRTHSDIERSVRLAVAESGLEPPLPIDFLVAASSGPTQFEAESEAVRRGSRSSALRAYPIKSLLGETVGSSGLLAVSMAAIGLKHRRTCPEDFRSDNTAHERVAIANSVRISGSNTSILLQDPPLGLERTTDG